MSEENQPEEILIEEAIDEETSKEKKSWRNWGDHPIIVTLATIGVLIGTVTSLLSVYQNGNSSKTETIQTAGILSQVGNLTSENPNDNTNANINPDIRSYGPERGTIVTIKGMKDGYLNLREKPTMDSAVVISAYNGDKVIVLEYGEEWSKVRFNDKTGYMYSKHIPKK